MLKLQTPSFGKEEILEVMDSLLSGYITMGEKVKKFEEKWREKSGTFHAVSCNSGSSANLLIISALKSPLMNLDWKDGDEIIVPAVAWSTTYFPIIQNNLVCRVVDSDVTTLNIDVDKIEAAINKKTKAIMIVHIAGSPCNMDKVVKLCNRYELFLIEDCCESNSAKWGEKKVGTFGGASSFSFMFSHHITTAGEGGMACTNNPQLNNVIKIQRAHGWIRDLDPLTRDYYKKQNPNINSDFLFVDTGYNVRMTDLQASFGLHQLNKLDNFVHHRRVAHKYLCNLILENNLDQYVDILKDRNKAYLSPFAFPMIARTIDIKNRLLEGFKTKVETRSIAAGNVMRQPFILNYKNFFKTNDPLIGANKITDNGFWIGNHQNITPKDYEKVIDIMKKVLK